MPATLPLNEMSVAEKLRAMEALWDDLCRSSGTIPSPAWHGEVLAERERLDWFYERFLPLHLSGSHTVPG